MISNALTIAGSDSGGGAGIQADLKTFSALGVYGASVVTAVTAQNTREVRAIHAVPPEFVAQQIDTVTDDIRIDAVKLGMLGSATVIEAVAERIQTERLRQVVLDPVMVAKSGDKLLRDDAVEALRRTLLPGVSVITPNLPEAAALLDDVPINDVGEMESVARRLLALGPTYVLLKGGHLAGNECPDLLVSNDEQHWFQAERIATKNTHGTGCTLSSATAAWLARGETMPSAVAKAKAYLDAALRCADELSVGHGHGPVQHFHASWPKTLGQGAPKNVDSI
jgi:hydroxymethylpyrimidine/phosphomethylpyrimidine kinase